MINDVGDFANGLHVNKYRNIRSDGGVTSDVQRRFSDIDFPIFRLAEMAFIKLDGKLSEKSDSI
jgi:hypothetical protein